MDFNYMFLLYFITYYVRDVGVAGSNPVTPAILAILFRVRSGHMGNGLYRTHR